MYSMVTVVNNTVLRILKLEVCTFSDINSFTLTVTFEKGEHHYSTLQMKNWGTRGGR